METDNESSKTKTGYLHFLSFNMREYRRTEEMWPRQGNIWTHRTTSERDRERGVDSNWEVNIKSGTYREKDRESGRERERERKR